ncbi:MAG: hypothetical protein AB9891_07745 [Anaerolineaceae bacterium]
MKPLPPILFALVMTGLVAASIAIIGGSALANRNTVPVVDSTTFTNLPLATVPSSSSQVSDTQQLIQQYQDREKQYQAQINEAVQRLNQANQQLQQENQAVESYQQVLVQLQQHGVIRIDDSGQIIPGREREHDDD